MPSTRMAKPSTKFSFDELHVTMSQRVKKSHEKRKDEPNKKKDNERKKDGMSSLVEIQKK